jgi:hypothetical protein
MGIEDYMAHLVNLTQPRWQRSPRPWHSDPVNILVRIRLVRLNLKQSHALERLRFIFLTLCYVDVCKQHYNNFPMHIGEKSLEELGTRGYKS